MTGRDLRAEVVQALADRPMTAKLIARTVTARVADVYDVLASGGFVRADRPDGSHPRSVWWRLADTSVDGSAAFPGNGRPTGEQRLLAVLSDGRAHRSADLYRRLGIMVHSRAARLRAKGYDVVCWRDGRDYFYRLLTEREPQADSNPVSADSVSSRSLSSRSVSSRERQAA